MAYRFGDLVNRAILRMAQVTGTGVQIYSEDIMAEMMQHKFAMVFEDRWWEDYTLWHKGTLTDQGVVDEDLSDANGADIDRYTDIRYIFFNNDARPLPRLRQEINPAQYENRGGRPQFHEPLGITGKFFRVLPYGDTQTVHINYRQRPEPFAPDDMVKMDDHLLILGTCYDYAEDDGTNPAATAKFLNLYNQRYEAVMGSVNEARVPLQQGYAPDQTPWGSGEPATG